MAPVSPLTRILASNESGSPELFAARQRARFWCANCGAVQYIRGGIEHYCWYSFHSDSFRYCLWKFLYKFVFDTSKGKVEHFNRYLRNSFWVPLAARYKVLGLVVDVDTANVEVARWLLHRQFSSMVDGYTSPKDVYPFGGTD